VTFRLCLIDALCVASLLALDTSKLKPQGHVNDFSNTLDAAARGQVEKYCTQLEQKTGVQMTIVLVATLQDEPIEDVASRLFREWEIGKKNADQGILLLFAVDDQKEHAETGAGLATLLPGDSTENVLRDDRPTLHMDSHGEAVFSAVQKIGAGIAKAKGARLDAQPRKGSWFGPAAIILYTCIAALIAGLVTIIPGVARMVWQTFLSPTTWYILISVATVVVILLLIGHDQAVSLFGSNIVSFYESAWPVLSMILAFLLFATRGDPLSLVFGSSGRRRRRGH
jgi:uncharacterized protein